MGATVCLYNVTRHLEWLPTNAVSWLSQYLTELEE
jgi:hypothetical protein